MRKRTTLDFPYLTPKRPERFLPVFLSVSASQHGSFVSRKSGPFHAMRPCYLASRQSRRSLTNQARILPGPQTRSGEQPSSTSIAQLPLLTTNCPRYSEINSRNNNPPFLIAGETRRLNHQTPLNPRPRTFGRRLHTQARANRIPHYFRLGIRGPQGAPLFSAPIQEVLLALGPFSNWCALISPSPPR